MRHGKDIILQKNSHPENGNVNCSLCKQQMTITEGTVIYGDKWFHNMCWNKLEMIENE